MTTAAAMSEAFAMADAAGIERKKLYDVMSAGPLHSGMMDFVKAYAVDGDPNQLAFTLVNAKKDVGYYSAMAEQAGLPSIMSQSVRMALTLAVAGGYGDRHVPEILEFFQQLSGKS